MEEEILDYQLNEFRKFSVRHGFSFAKPIVFICAFFTLIGLLIIVFLPLIGIIMVGFFGFIATSTYGFQLDWSGQQFREYGAAFGVKRGKWNDLSIRPDITILTENFGYQISSLSNRQASDIEKGYGIYLLSKNHRERNLVKQFKTWDSAFAYAQKFSKALVLNLSKYNPQVSMKTRQRR